MSCESCVYYMDIDDKNRYKPHVFVPLISGSYIGYIQWGTVVEMYDDYIPCCMCKRVLNNIYGRISSDLCGKRVRLCTTGVILKPNPRCFGRY
jgi:hypothetical protein